MNFANARFLDASRHTVLVDIDGSAATEPADPSNRHYAALVSSGTPIAPAPVPEPSATDVRAEASRRLQVAFGARDAAHLDIIVANATREVARLNQIKVSAASGRRLAGRAARMDGRGAREARDPAWRRSDA